MPAQYSQSPSEIYATIRFFTDFGRSYTRTVVSLSEGVTVNTPITSSSLLPGSTAIDRACSAGNSQTVPDGVLPSATGPGAGGLPQPARASRITSDRSVRLPQQSR